MSKKEIKILSSEEVNNRQHCLTVKDLKQWIIDRNIPDNAKVLIQKSASSRLGVYTKPNNVYPAHQEQYFVATSCVGYKDESNKLFIDVEY